MNKILSGLMTLCVTASSWASAPLPSDVQRYIEQREGCDHMRGEVPDPSEKQRMKEVAREIRKLCKGTDARLKTLKKKYAKNPAVVEQLDAFEPDIEATRH